MCALKSGNVLRIILLLRRTELIIFKMSKYNQSIIKIYNNITIDNENYRDGDNNIWASSDPHTLASATNIETRVAHMLHALLTVVSQQTSQKRRKWL